MKKLLLLIGIILMTLSCDSAYTTTQGNKYDHMHYYNNTVDWFTYQYLYTPYYNTPRYPRYIYRDIYIASPKKRKRTTTNTRSNANTQTYRTNENSSTNRDRSNTSSSVSSTRSTKRRKQ